MLWSCTAYSVCNPHGDGPITLALQFRLTWMCLPLTSTAAGAAPSAPPPPAPAELASSATAARTAATAAS
eukprot:gene7986-biopygen6274